MQSCFALVILLLISLALLTPNAHGDSDTNINFYFADLLRGSSGNLTSPSTGTRPSCVESPLIVVGGGWSGLTTAIEAKKRGCRVLLLEGQNYLGGRSHTVRTGGSIVEFGSNWVHGTPETGHPFPDFMESLGFDTSDPDVLFRVDAVNATSSAAVIGFLNSLGYPGQWFANDTRLGNASIDRSFQISEEWFEHMAEAITERQTKGSPLCAPGDVSVSLGELTSPSVQAWKRNLTTVEIGYKNWHVNNDYSEDFAASIEQMSLFNYYPPQRLYEGGNNVIPFGYSVIVNKYAEALTSTELYLNTKVIKIEHSPTGVKVYTANGTVHSGSTVVVTVPLGVLKNDVIEFVPPVDAPIAQAISALDMGTLDKIWLKFEKPFWDVNTYTWFVLPDADDPSQKPSFMNTFFNALFERRPGDNQNVLGYFVGAGTEYKLYLSDQEIIDQSMSVLYSIFGTNISQPIGVIRTNWTNNPFTYGTYSYPRTYSELYHFSNFIVNGSQSSLHFGGEHTSRTGFGFQYGAQATGYREARAILALPENVAAGVRQISEEEYQTLAGHPDEVEYLPNVKRGEEASYPPYTPYCEAYNVYLQRKNAGLVQ